MVRVSHIGSRGIPGYRGGVERVLEAVTPRLVALGYEVTVYCSHWSDYDGATYNGVRLVRIPSIRSKYLDTFSRSFLATLREVFSASDIVHFHASGSAPLALLARLFGKKTVVTVHGLDWQRRKWNRFGRWFLRIGEWAAVKFPHKTVAVGPQLKRYLDERYNTVVTYIPNGVEERPKRPPDRIKAYGIGTRDYVLYLGRLVPEKQCHVLIEAFQGLQNRAGLKAVIAGPTWHSKEYVEGLRRQATDDSAIVFTGEVDEHTLEELYSNCYAYVLPSEVEGMSLSLLDAMAFGSCVIASDIPANADVVGDAGVLFKTGDAGDLRSKLVELIDDPERVQRYRELAKSWITQEYSWDNVVRRWKCLYNRLHDAWGPDTELNGLADK